MKALLPTPNIPPLMSLFHSGANQEAARKLVNQKPGAKNAAKALKTVNKAKVLVSMAKNVSTKMVAKNVKTAKLPVKEEEKTDLAKQETSSGSKSTSPENQSDTGDSKEELVPENAATTSKEVGMKDAVEVDESANRTVSEPAEAPPIGERVPVSQAETQAATDVSVPSKSADSENPTHVESLKLNHPETKVQESLEVHKETVESGKASPPTVVKLQGIGSSLSHSDVLSAVKHFGKTKSVILVRARLEAVVIFEKEEDARKLKSVRSLNVNGTEITVITEKDTVSKEEKPLPLRPPVSCGASSPASSSAKVLLPSPSTPKAGLEKASAQQKPKPPEDQLPAGEAATKEHVEATAAKDARKPTDSTADIQADGENSKPQEPLAVSEDTAQAAVKVVEHTARAKVDGADDAGEPMELGGSGVKFEGNSEPGSSAQGPETMTEVSQVQQQATGCKNDAAAVEAVMPDGGTETQTTQEGPLTAGGSQMDSTSTNEASKAVCQVPSVSTEVSKQLSAAVAGLTIGEMLEKHLFPKDITAWQPYCLSQTLPYGYKQLLVSGLPMYYPGFYTETDVANLLLPLGFQNKEDKLFVIPQARMAFVTMPAVENVLHLTRTAAQSGVFFRGTRLVFEVINIRYPLTAAQFYTYLKKVLKCSVSDEAERTVLIWNISQSGIRHLREALKEFGPVTNFMPLLNKLFVEFEFVEDADRFGGWYSEVKQTAGSKVVRLKGPNVNSQSLRPVPAVTTQADASKTDGKVSAGTEKPGTSEAALSAVEAESKEGVAEVATVPSKSEASGKQPDLGDSEVKPEASGAGAGRQEKSAEITDSETESATQKCQIPAEELAATEADTGIEGPGVLLKDSEGVGLASQAETVSTTQEPNTQADKLGANAAASEHVSRSDDANEPMEVGEPGRTGQTGTSSSQETGTGTSEEHQQVAEEAAVEAETGTTHTEMTQMDSTSTKEASGASAPPLGKDSVAASSVKTKAAAAAAAASRSSSSAVIWPTIGEMLDKYLFPKSIHTLMFPHVTALSYNQQLLICGLPTYHDGCYTEDDVADLLVPFGFKNKQEKLYVIPQTRMAFATMPSLANVYEILKEYKQKGIYFWEKRLTIHIVRLRYQMKLHQFYRFLKKVMKCSVTDEVERTVFIRNISQREIRELREALKEFGAVKNFMPLLNKLFVEFEFVEDADRFGGWYSEVKQTAGQEVIRLKTQGPVAAMTTQTGIAKDANLTFGEMFENHLSRKIIASFKSKSGTSTKMLISWLPAYSEGSYTENDLIELLTPFGYQHKDHNIYVAPQASLAFVLMPTAGDVSDIIRASRRDPIIFKESELRFHALDNTISMRPFWFYESLMTRLDYCMNEDRDAVIFIRDISPTETRELREALTKMGSIRNFLPLLNKVFVVFQTACNADWLGVWYSLLRQSPGYRIQRLKIPLSTSSPPSPMVPKDCLLDSKDLIDGITVPSAKIAIPQFSPSPFWISLRNSPFVFPTISPWFIIPEYQTVKGLFDIEKASRRGSMCPTIMLTGLPEGNYKHEDVARLVWPYFPKQTLHSLYYNVTVLPLQRRAFVFFSDWTTCSDFVAAHVAKRVSLKGRIVGVHFVLQNMYPESSEEMMYRSLMKWSNAGVPDPTSLEERLLCVEVSEVSLDIITLVIEMVASIATFVNFLPLANRICIEMTDSSGVTEVVEKYKDPSPNSFTADPAWSRVKNFESLESLKQRLQDSAEVTINLDKPGATVGRDESPEIDEDMLKAITVTVGENRLVQKSRSQSAERQGEDDFTDDLVSSDAYLFDEEQFNEEEFVTVDEVFDDVEDLSPEPRRYSSSKYSSRERGERQSSGGSSSHHRTSTRSSRDYKSSASASSSRSNKGSRSDPKHSSKPTKSSTKTSSSASASKASSLPPPVWTESPSSLDKKTQPSSTKSPLKSSSTKREKIEASVEPVREGAKDTESAVAKSDHRVSAEGAAAKYVESEAEIEMTREMHPAQQEHGSDLNQAQHLEIDLDTNKTQKKSKEDDTHTEEVGNSSDGQTDERMEECGQDGSSAPQLTGSEGGQVVDRDEGPLQARDSGAAISQGDSGPVQRDASTSKQEPEEGSGPTADQSDEKPAVKDEESLQDHPQERDDKPNLRDPDTDGTDQEAFEILDSIDDQTDMEEKQIPKDDDGPAEDGEEAYEVIDSVGDPPTTTESESEQKQQRPRRGRTASRKDDRPSRRSGPTSKAAEESPKRQDRTVKAPETRTKMDKKAGTEETLFEIVDSVEEGDAASRESSGRRRSTRGKPEEVTYEILDSVENEPVAEEPTITTRRSTRGKRGRTAEDASTGKTKEEDAPTGRRQTAPRENTAKKDEKAPPKESERVGAEGDPREEVATYEVLDSVEDEVLNDQPVTRGKGKRGRPKRQVKAALKKDGATSEKVAKEEEATYRILDSVEDESVDDQPPSDQSGNKSKESVSKNATQQDQDRTSLEGSTKKEAEEEEEPLFQIVDSLEDDQVQEEMAPTEVCDGAKTGEESRREEGEKDEAQTCCATVLEASEELVEKEESLLQRVDELEEGNEGSDTGDAAALEREKSPEKEQTPSTLVSLDEVSDEEEDYPDDREEEEELRRRQAVAKEKRFPKEQDARGRREARERRSRSDGSRGEGGDDGRRSRRGKEDERAEADAREMVTLDEVGADEAKDETAPERRVSDEEDARALVTLDEFVDEEAEEKAEPIKVEARPLGQEDESVDDLNQETLVTLDEACCDEEDKLRDEQAEEALGSSKRKHDDDTEEGMNFVIVDEVKDEEKEETSTPRTRGRPKKRTRLTPVRKSTRGKNVVSHEEEKEPSDDLPPASLEASSSMDKDASKLSNVGEQAVQKAAEVEATTQADIDTASADPELQPEDKTLEKCAEISEEEEREEKSRTDIKDASKKRRDAVGPEAKRSRSQSPSVPADFKLLEFKPNNPLGKEFVVPGYFCKLCSVFYKHESTAKELHCSSQTHFNNLQKHYRELQQKAGSSTPKSSGLLS
ncbi:uncharacterized protein LOC132958789 [Labrus mixtus]|uniref:uncharacterized protein LOC132958789 n=1 Tax=Labrus mixtus TaxID=508554 RepID=UPI0029C006A9|nr:uncharacterized protein LOC132958789 [Labrus mixtus]